MALFAQQGQGAAAAALPRRLSSSSDFEKKSPLARAIFGSRVMAVYLFAFHTRKSYVFQPRDFAELQEMLATEGSIRCARADQILMDLAGRRVADLAGPCGTTEDNPVFLFHRNALVSTKPLPHIRLLCERFAPRALLSTGHPIADIQSHMLAIQDFSLGLQHYDRCAHTILHAAAMQRASLRGLIANLQAHLDRIVQDFESFSRHLKSLRETDEMLAQNADTVAELLHTLPPPVPAASPARLDDVFVAALESFRALLQTISERSPAYKSAVDAVRDAVAAIDRNVLDDPGMPQEEFSTFRRKIAELIKIVQTQCERASIGNWDSSILAQYIPHHVEIGASLRENEDLLWDTLCQLEHRGQAYALRAHTAMQRLCAAQLKIKACQRYDRPDEFSDRITEALRLGAQLLAGARLPHAVARLRPEIERRREFKRHYDEACATAFSKISKLRQVELARRRQFFTEHGQALQRWFALPGLDDYPHSCVALPRPFDTALPIISQELDEQYQTLWHSASQQPLYAQCLQAWGCCQPEPAPSYPWAERAVQTDADLPPPTAHTQKGASRSDSLSLNPTSVPVPPGPAVHASTQGSDAASAGAGAAAGLAEMNKTVAALEDQIAALHVECELYRRHCQQLADERARVTAQMHRVVAEMEQERKRLQMRLAEGLPPSRSLTTATNLPDFTLPRTIAMEHFKVGDLALFCPWKGHKDRIAYNIGAPYRILPFERLAALGVRTATPYLGRITTIEERRASENDTFGVPVNTVYYLLDCIPATQPRE
eukprot:m.56375 g.56375  ORF g.56375 m.56375 type:complete len:775 (-) comp12032_c0_seq5:476-2800(-)